MFVHAYFVPETVLIPDFVQHEKYPELRNAAKNIECYNLPYAGVALRRSMYKQDLIDGNCTVDGMGTGMGKINLKKNRRPKIRNRIKIRYGICHGKYGDLDLCTIFYEYKIYSNIEFL